MINCPNCDKQIADDSAHCGYCGHQIAQKNKKNTMFGMAALGGDELKKAVEQAKEAKKDKENSSGGQGSDAKSEKGGGLKIPKPGKGPKNEGGPVAGNQNKGLKLPKPGQKSADSDEAPEGDGPDFGFAKTERIDLSDAQPPDASLDDSSDEPSESGLGLKEPSEAPTAHLGEISKPQHELSASEGDRPKNPNASTQPVDLSEDPVDVPGGPTEPSPNGPAFDEPTSNEPTSNEPAGLGPSQVSQAGAQSGPFGPGAKEAEQAQQDQKGGQQGNQVQVGRAGSMPAGSNPPANQGGFGQKEIGDSHPAHRQNQMQTQGQEGEGKSKKGMIIGIVIATMVLGGGCTIALAYWAYTAFF